MADWKSNNNSFSNGSAMFYVILFIWMDCRHEVWKIQGHQMEIHNADGAFCHILHYFSLSKKNLVQM